MIELKRSRYAVSLFIFFVLVGCSVSLECSAQGLMDTSKGLDYATGRAIFKKKWVSAPSSTTASDGLGPLYNARSCEQCHPDGGRGGLTNSLVIQINSPNYGQQIQTLAVVGQQAEAQIIVQYEESEKLLSESESVIVHLPNYSLSEISLDDSLLESYSPRIASSLFGLGLIESIPGRLIRELEDVNDDDGDGVSGRISQVLDPISGRYSLGRFGWKASESSLRSQTARALNLDIGISSSLYPQPYGDCQTHQTSCFAAANGNSSQHDNLEASNVMVESLVNYVSKIPAPLDHLNKNTKKGADIFEKIGCGTCHHASFELDSGVIKPYSDFLLHDLGEGLKDSLSRGAVLNSEWRSAPLWGLSRVTEYLHDGRAKSLVEAIVWHGGEAAPSVERYRGMSKSDRDDLLRFLNAL